MSSEDLAIKVENVSMQFEMYARPSDQLKQYLLPRLQRSVGLQPREYFQPFLALDNISFDVKKGESVGIIGRNGSGKSTLLQIITGTLSLTSGKVETYGRIAALLELGSGFNPEFTGRENVYLNGALLGMSHEQIDARFDAIAAFADIGSHLDQPVKTYSSGMLVRLAFAVQVQVEPDILIVDEALAVGDALFQKRCFQQLEKLVSNGTSLLFVSHDQESIRTLTNRALLLHRGKLLDCGLSSEVVLNYRRLLHDEESAYFADLAQSMAKRAQNAHHESAIPASDEIEDGNNVIASQLDEGVRSSRLTFGDGEVKVVKVETFNTDEDSCSLFYPGQRIRIKIDCESFEKIDKLNVAVRLRNKEGVKVYSWGTLNQDMTTHARNLSTPIFWHRQFEAGETFQVLLECDCTLGENLYEVQAAVSHEQTMDYMSQRMLHWVDEAAFFQVSIKRDDYFFGGVTDLRMKAIW
jgi:lipopolysaccharide transport system ATP-binding protein